MGVVIDYARVGTKGHPRHYAELGIEPPTKFVEDAPTSPGLPPETVAALTPVAPISDRQFASELRHRGLITLEESLAYLGRGEIPAQLLGLINQITDDAERDNTLELVTGATSFVFEHPASIKIGALFQWTDDQRRQFWIAAGLR